MSWFKPEAPENCHLAMWTGCPYGPALFLEGAAFAGAHGLWWGSLWRVVLGFFACC